MERVCPGLNAAGAPSHYTISQPSYSPRPAAFWKRPPFHLALPYHWRLSQSGAISNDIARLREGVSLRLALPM
jgi:hypothetical protein